MKKELNIALVGTGGIGQTHIERINDTLKGGNVVAVSDVNTDFGKKIADKYKLKFFEDAYEMIAADEIDAVMVTASDEHHEEFVVSAIEHGKYVFCEKPLAPTKEGAKRIVDAEVKGGKKLVQVGFMRRFDKGYLQLKEMIQSGDYGDPLLMYCAHRNYSDPAANWTTATTIPNALVHEMDICRWLLDEDYESVEVVLPKSSKHANPQLLDPQIMILTTKSGVRIDVEGFMNSRYGYDIQCEIICEEGVMNLPEPANAYVRSDVAIKYPIFKDWSYRFVDAYNIEIQEWMDACLEGRTIGPDAWDGYVAAATSDAAVQARETGETVKIELEPRSDFYKSI